MATWHIGTLDASWCCFCRRAASREADDEINVTREGGGPLSALGELRGDESTLEKASDAKEATVR